MNVKYQLATAIGLMGLSVVSAPAYAADVNLVTNGTFSNPTGYSSDYANCGSGPYVCPGSTAGNEYFAKNASDVNGSFYGLTDHTGDGGYLLVVDPSGAGSFFNQTFAVAANSAYTFNFFASQLNFGSSVIASINGTILGTFTPGTGWTSFSATYNSGATTLANLRLDAGSFSQSYNDFGVDDASFTGPAAVAAVPEPATWGMMILGFALVGGAARYRRRGAKLAFA
ncbi:MAG: type sorting protein [Bradyrhizobium sp.]|nr:type sorting protein [Bradyrhizobium sp.]